MLKLIGFLALLLITSHQSLEFLLGTGMEYYLGDGVSILGSATIGTSHGTGTVEYLDPDSFQVVINEREKFHLTSFAGLIQAAVVYRF
ncbi:MAG: hypothetical protein ACI837_000676 [Crocinitomicaceae bacterium]|jgi:hypothetical protein